VDDAAPPRIEEAFGMLVQDIMRRHVVTAMSTIDRRVMSTFLSSSTAIGQPF
jgi:hypothetical protein